MKDSEETTKNLSISRLRIKSLIWDWLFIWAYLIVLFGLVLLFYLIVFDGIPDFTSMQSQLIATMTSIVPIILIFSIMEGRTYYASFGKRKSHLKVVYTDRPMSRSFVRNSLKFLPWQLGHMSTINGLYNGFETPFSISFFVLSISLAIVYILMVFVRKDGRHLADLLSGSRVIQKKSVSY